MPLLCKTTFTHWSQKDSASGISGYVIADNEDQVFNFMSGHFNLEYLDDDETAEVSPHDGWWEAHPEAAKLAEEAGLTVHMYDWGERYGEPDYVSGPVAAVIRWWRFDPREVSDLCYGAIRHGWEVVVVVDPATANVLIGSTVAEDIR